MTILAQYFKLKNEALSFETRLTSRHLWKLVCNLFLRPRVNKAVTFSFNSQNLLGSIFWLLRNVPFADSRSMIYGLQLKKKQTKKKNNKNKVKMTEIIILQTDCQCLNKGHGILLNRFKQVINFTEVTGRAQQLEINRSLLVKTKNK